MTGLGRAAAIAHPNLAFVKYWGKRHDLLRLPATGSISMTLSGLSIRTAVEWGTAAGEDEIVLSGRPVLPDERRRISEFLDRVREMAGIRAGARVVSESDFPRGAGLASSAGGFAALALAASRAAGLELSERELAILARLGSGSATRSVHGGFVEWVAGTVPDGSDSHGVPVAGPDHWPELRLIAAVVSKSAKPCSSTEGMRRSAETSPFYAPWLASHAADLATARRAILGRDFQALGEVSESNAVRMHAVCLAARPPIVYWNSGTLEVMVRTAELRASGACAYYSIDAGPNVFVISLAPDEERVVREMRALASVESVHVSAPGEGARSIDPAVL